MRRVLVAAFVVTVLAVGCQGNDPKPVPAREAALTDGDVAPTFSLESPDGEVSLADYHGRKPVLLYFSMGPG